MIDFIQAVFFAIAFTMLAGEIALFITYRGRMFKVLSILKNREISGYDNNGMFYSLYFDGGWLIVFCGDMITVGQNQDFTNIAWIYQPKFCVSPLSVAPIAMYFGNKAYKQVKDIVNMQKEMASL